MFLAKRVSTAHTFGMHTSYPVLSCATIPVSKDITPDNIPKSRSSSRSASWRENVSGTKISLLRRKSRKSASAAFLRTMGRAPPLSKTRCTSAASASANSLPPTFATKLRPRHWKISDLEMMSSRTELITSLKNSCVSLSKTEATVYPTCFSEYLGAEIKPTTCMCPNSTSYPSM